MSSPATTNINNIIPPPNQLASQQPSSNNPKPGPTINNRPTTLTTFTHQTLPSLTSLPHLISLINAAYSIGKTRGFQSADHERLSSPSQLLSELGPSGRIFVLRFADARSDDEFPDGLLGCGVDQPAPAHDDAGREEMLDHLDRTNSLFHRRGDAAKLVPGVAEWDLKLMAVAPGCVRRGVAGWMLGALEGDIREKSSVAQAVDGDEESVKNRIRVRITTWAEMNEGFYTRRGFEAVGRALVPAGQEGVEGSKPFHIVHMDKWLS